MSIFISIASYRDPEVVRTIRSILDNASGVYDIHFGLVIQEQERDIPDLSWVPNMSLMTMHHKEAKGAGYARSIAMNLYNKQDYFLQIDSHTLFEKDWDLLCISELKKAQQIANNSKIILSYFPPPFFIESNGSVSFPTKDPERLPYPTTQKPFENKRKEWTAIRVEFKDKAFKNPELSSTILAGFIFSTGEIVKDVPYDPEISFFGEEVCFAMRAWTRGWDIYSPSKKILYHFYGRGGYKKIWKDSRLKFQSWKDLEDISKEKQMKVLCGIEQGIFGAGNKRSLQEYEKFCGQNFKEFYGIDFD